MKTEEDEDEKRVEERVGSNPGAIPLHGSVGFRFGDPNPNPGSLVASSTVPTGFQFSGNSGFMAGAGASVGGVCFKSGATQDGPSVFSFGASPDGGGEKADFSMGIGDGSNSGTTGSKRRSTSPLNNNQAPAVLNRGSSGDLEEILGQITRKMTSLGVNLSNEDKITAFISVLDIDSEYAQFFLESADWDIEAAVVVYLDSFREDGDINGLGQIQAVVQQQGNGGRTNKRNTTRAVYSPRDVIIDGLPAGWMAKVHVKRGHVYFIHAESGYEQSEVPPGYADAILFDDSAGGSQSQTGGTQGSNNSNSEEGGLKAADKTNTNTNTNSNSNEFNMDTGEAQLQHQESDAASMNTEAAVLGDLDDTDDL